MPLRVEVLRYDQVPAAYLFPAVLLAKAALAWQIYRPKHRKDGPKQPDILCTNNVQTEIDHIEPLLHGSLRELTRAN